MDESTRRAREVLEQLEEVCAGFTPRAAVVEQPIGAETMAAADFIGLKVGTMTAAQYSRWCDLGQPPLTAPPKPKQQSDDTARMIRQHVSAGLRTVAAALGAEVGQSERALRQALEQELWQLKAELGVVRAALSKRIESLEEQAAVMNLPQLPMRSARHEH